MPSIPWLLSHVKWEKADVFCQTLLLARFFDVDLEKEVAQKWLAWNKT